MKQTILRWARRNLAKMINVRALKASPHLHRILRWPIPSIHPLNLKEIHVFRPSALGDVLLCTPALRELRRFNPRAKIIFYTGYPQLIDGLGLVDEIRKPEDTPPGQLLYAPRYEEFIPPDRHIAVLFGQQLGVNVRDLFPSCAIDDRLRSEWNRQLQEQAKGRKIVAINRKAGPWTPNKDWPDDCWQAGIQQFVRDYFCVDIGSPASQPLQVQSEHYLDLRGKTSLSELIALLANVDLHVGPISGPVHIAAAFRIPSVVIYGGYEDPICSAYPGNINLVNQPECSPCWMAEPCPHKRKCLTNISVESVRLAIESLLNRS